ncbi:MAG: hexose kinase, partial [Candidatus Omnitrophica bacterium]|nr:hexose kinase [Candidatus Omnitrophota bacterium]MBD3268986.1 hexose kinase [Candidatus Omnitrophota bacterium]
MKPLVLTVTLNPAIDKTVVIPHFSKGKDFRERSLSVSPGGKGINVSRSLNSLGIKNIATGLLGGHDGNYILNELKKEKIKNKFLKIRENTRTSLTIIDPADKTLTRVMERGPLVTKKELDEFKKIFADLLKKACFVVLSGRSIPGASEHFYSVLIKMAKQKNIPAILDTSGTPYLKGIENKPFMIKPNLKEAEFITGKELKTPADIKKAALKLRQNGIKIVTISMGSKGALVWDGERMIMGTPPRVKRKSPVGCGDSFIAGFLSSYLRGKEIP